MAFAQGGSTGPIRMVFSDTNVASVLKAIATRTGANIVYAGKDKTPITINVTVSTVEQAVQTVTSAAGLSFRRVNNFYVVAPAEQMRQALEPYGQRVRFAVPEGSAEMIVASVREAFPHATVQVLGGELVFRGLAEDVAEARPFIERMASMSGQTLMSTEIVPIGSVDPAELEKVVGNVSKDVKVSAVKGDQGAPAAVALFGPRNQVVAAREVVERIVMNRPVDPNVFEVYEIRYSNANTLVEFLGKTMKEVEAFVAPESFSPSRAAFQPIGAQAVSAAGNSVSGGSGGGGGQGGAGEGGQGGGDLKDPNRPVLKGDRAKRIVLRGPKNQVAQAVKLLESVDLKPKQVMVEVQVVETSPNLNEELGFDFNWAPYRLFEVPPGTGFSGVDGIDLTDFVSNPVGLGQWSTAPWSIATRLKAKTLKGEAKMLANPKVQVIDNDGASIFIGDTLRVQVAQAGALGAQTVEIREFPVGIILLIHPRINADGNITMHVNPVVSSISGMGPNNIPQTSSREAETTVMVKDGETIVLGGLIRDEYSKMVTSVPLLSQLPLVGELFKNRSTSKRRTDVVVTITPRIVHDGTKEAQPK
jgi:type II secretory pathway component GspD/PulD (secretin)